MATRSLSNINEKTDRDFCYAMLPLVSRTFAACIKLLPDGLEYPVLIAYLLCRIADTIEDTADISVEEKTANLALFSRSLEDPSTDTSAIQKLFAQPRIDDERLTRDLERTLNEFRQLPSAQQDAIRPWVQEMCDGMAAFAGQHAAASPDNLVSLRSVEDLDKYCYYVAGTVGHLLTDLFFQHHHRVTKRHYDSLKSLATSFGLGLQLTNIIKDVADDRQRGWSFVPSQLCQLAGIDPKDFLDPAKKKSADHVMRILISKASRHLRDALDYCLALPRSQYRMRLFCLTPLYFAVRTLRLARSDSKLLDPQHKVKISRAQVYRTVRMTHLIASNNHLVRAYFRRLAAGSI